MEYNMNEYDAIDKILTCHFGHEGRDGEEGVEAGKVAEACIVSTGKGSLSQMVDPWTSCQERV